MTEEYKEMTRFMERYKDLAFAHLARAEKAEAKLTEIRKVLGS